MRHKFNYPTDILTKDPQIIKKWVDWADIVNCYFIYTPRYRRFYEIPDKKLIWSHIGSIFRAKHREIRELSQKLKPRMLISSIELLFYEDLTWLPNAVPVDDWLKMKTSHTGKPIVCQTPNSRKQKRTNEILAQIANKVNVNIHIIENVPWRKCMQLKSKADIYIGEFNIGYGMSELEAMAMKIPVITNLSPRSDALLRREVGTLPHYDCPLVNLSDGIDKLLSDKDLYDKHVELGFEYVKRFHDYPVVAKKFIAICESM